MRMPSCLQVEDFFLTLLVLCIHFVTTRRSLGLVGIPKCGHKSLSLRPPLFSNRPYFILSFPLFLDESVRSSSFLFYMDMSLDSADRSGRLTHRTRDHSYKAQEGLSERAFLSSTSLG